MTGDEIRLASITVVYDRKLTIPAVQDITFAMRRGEFVCLLGPSGCGKSTILHVVGGFLKPTDGSITINGQNVVRPSRSVGVVFQDYSLFYWRTVARNASFGLEHAGLDRMEQKSRLAEILSRTGLTSLASRYPWQLSGGERQRVAIARALAPNPPILLLDEPFRSLDTLTKEKLNGFLLALWDRDKQTVLFITHDLDEALRLADRILVMAPHPGRIIADVPVTFSRPRSVDLALSSEFVEAKRSLAALLRPEV